MIRHQIFIKTTKKEMNSMSKKTILITGAICIILLIMCGYRGLKIVKDGASSYVFGYPLVLMDVTKKVFDLPPNNFIHLQRFPDHTSHEVVRPNNDTLYSTSMLDLSFAPLVLSVPDTAGRYYVMPFMDAWTNVFDMVGKRKTGTGPGSFLIVGPDWQGPLPSGLEKIQSPTNMVWLLGRIQANGKDDLKNVFKLQKQFTLTSLGNWPNGHSNPSQKITKPSSGGGEPLAIMDKMSPAEFFSYLNQLMGDQPPTKEDGLLMGKMKNFGIQPGHSFAVEDLGVIKRILLKIGVKLARKEMKTAVQEERFLENNWKVLRDDIGTYGTNYPARAVVAQVGLGALPPKEAVYAFASKDKDGNPLFGQNRYRIRFEKGNTPPVGAFWSLTLYNDRGFLVDNPIKRYIIGDRDKLLFNLDGSLDILIQHSKPKSTVPNWLPSPEDGFNLTLRLYMPEKEFFNKAWKLPSIVKVK